MKTLKDFSKFELKGGKEVKGGTEYPSGNFLADYYSFNPDETAEDPKGEWFQDPTSGIWMWTPEHPDGPAM